MSQLMHSSAENRSPLLLGREGSNSLVSTQRSFARGSSLHKAEIANVICKVVREPQAIAAGQIVTSAITHFKVAGIAVVKHLAGVMLEAPGR